MRHSTAPEGRRLLCVLLLWLDCVPTEAVERRMLRNVEQVLSYQTCGVDARADWARGARGLLIWGVPVAILAASSLMPVRWLVVVWPPVLAFMGVACLLNARRCGRTHCYVTAPFFLVLAALALLCGVGVLPLGPRGWTILSSVLVAGGIALTCGPDLLLGRYRT